MASIQQQQYHQQHQPPPGHLLHQNYPPMQQSSQQHHLSQQQQLHPLSAGPPSTMHNMQQPQQSHIPPQLSHRPSQLPPQLSQQQSQKVQQQQQHGGPSMSQMHPSQHSISHALQKLASANEQTWLHIGSMAETVGDYDRATSAYENALRNNPYSVPALTQIAALCRARDQFPKEPKLWYGIGILYDRYGSFENAEEAFSSVLKMDPKFEKANEIYFRLGIIYKQQGKYDLSLQCFKYILNNPPKPLNDVDIWFQLGHVHEFQGDFNAAKEAYDLVLRENPNHAKVLQQLGWLHYQPNSSFTSQDQAVHYLTKSLESDGNDPQTWYLLGRTYMVQQKHNKAYEAYQQAVYRDGRNPIFWCSIGVLYFQIGQYRDALDAYTRAIRINPYMTEVWFNLGTLYESCNNQLQDALDAYSRALELDPKNNIVSLRLQYLKTMQANGGKPAGSPVNPPPAQDINPNTYRHGFPGQQVPPPFSKPPHGGSIGGGSFSGVPLSQTVTSTTIQSTQPTSAYPPNVSHVPTHSSQDANHQQQYQSLQYQAKNESSSSSNPTSPSASLNPPLMPQMQPHPKNANSTKIVPPRLDSQPSSPRSPDTRINQELPEIASTHREEKKRSAEDVDNYGKNEHVGDSKKVKLGDDTVEEGEGFIDTNEQTPDHDNATPPPEGVGEEEEEEDNSATTSRD